MDAKRKAFAVLFLVVGCTPSPSLEPVTPATACRLDIGALAQAPWRAVQTPRYSYCVPGDWQPDAWLRTGEVALWRTREGTIAWGFGVEPPVPSRSCSPARNVVEQVDGRDLHLTEVACEDGWHTRASWTGSNWYLMGMARHSGMAQMQWAVYRTVRLTAGSR
jgi:hypothetical protein